MLFAIYVIASLVPVGVLGAVLVRGYHDEELERGRDQGRAQAAVIEQMAIGPALKGADLSVRLSDDVRTRLQSATDLAIFKGSVSHLQLRSFLGNVAFTDDPTTGHTVPFSDPAFGAAKAGATDVRILDGPGQSPATIRVLLPVSSSTNGETTGLLEVYLPYDAIAAKVAVQTQRAIIRLLIGLVGLFAVMALISWWTTRALRQHAALHEYDSLHDPLTGLPNRELFRQTAEGALARGRRGEHGAVVLIDLDHFKEVNDTIGHHAGDELLRVVGRRLSGSLRTDDLVARLGGDEFAMVLPRGGGAQETVALLNRVRHELAEEVVLDGIAVSIEASFGVCFYPESADTVEDLLQHADSAMYQGKQFPGGVVIYEPQTPHHATHALVIQSELRSALDRDELVLHYQPKMELGSGRVTCVEALVRWQHPERGLLLPADFLAAAERSDLIETLTSWVLRRALADYTAWTAAGHDWSVAVNVSARNLTSLTFPGSVSQILRDAGVPPSRLHLEASEGALTCEPELAGQVVTALAAQGVSMSVDHFGLGFTGLSRLCSTGVSEIKIDQTFVADLPGRQQDRAIVRSVVDLGHSLGCVVTAQGVESQIVADVLVDAGCDQAQGYLWLRPGPWPEVARAVGDPAALATADAEATGNVPTRHAPARAGHKGRSATE
jgi:diguanylate cyclase